MKEYSETFEERLNIFELIVDNGKWIFKRYNR